METNKSLIVNHAVYAHTTGSIATIDLAKNLTIGAIAFYDASGVLIPSNATAINSNEIAMVVGLGNGRTIKIENISKVYLSYVKNAYAAATAKKMVIGGDGTSYSLNLPSTILAGQSAIIRIYNMTQLNDNNVYEEHVIPCVGGDSAATLLASAVTLINKNSKLVTAAIKGSNVGLTLTQKSDANFTARCSGVFANADILEYKLVNNIHTPGYSSSTHVVPFYAGVGTYVQAVNAEKSTSIVNGNGNYPTDNDLMYTEPATANSSVNYDVYTYTYSNKVTDQFKSMPVENTIVLYVNNTVTAGVDVTETVKALSDLL